MSCSKIVWQKYTFFKNKRQKKPIKFKINQQFAVTIFKME